MAEHVRVGGAEITAVSSISDEGQEVISLLIVPTGTAMVVSAIAGLSPETGGAAVSIKIRRG